MSVGKERKKASVGSNPRKQSSGSKSLQEQLKELGPLRDSDPLFPKVFGSDENCGVDPDGDFDFTPSFQKREVHPRRKNWYKDIAETQTSVDALSNQGGRFKRQTEKERKMNTEQTSTAAEDMAAKKEAENVGSSGPAKNAAEQAFHAGAEWARRMGQADAAKDTAKEAAKGIWGGMKSWYQANKTKVGIALGVAGTVGATAAVKAYKDRQGQHTARMGDTTVSWTTEGAPGTPGAGGGAAPGAAPAGAGEGGRGRGR